MGFYIEYSILFTSSPFPLQASYVDQIVFELTDPPVSFQVLGIGFWQCWWRNKCNYIKVYNLLKLLGVLWKRLKHFQNCIFSTQKKKKQKDCYFKSSLCYIVQGQLELYYETGLKHQKLNKVEYMFSYEGLNSL